MLEWINQSVFSTIIKTEVLWNYTVGDMVDKGLPEAHINIWILMHLLQLQVAKQYRRCLT